MQIVIITYMKHIGNETQTEKMKKLEKALTGSCTSIAWATLSSRDREL